MKGIVLALTIILGSWVVQGSVPDKCFSIAKLFPNNQTLLQSGLIISDLNLLLGSKFKQDMHLSSVTYCHKREGKETDTENDSNSDSESDEAELTHFQIKLR